jgi:adenylate cyclase
MKTSAAHRDLPGRVLLRGLLSERNQHPERIDEIDAKIKAEFERDLAILVLDMVGFSRISHELGIITYLAMIAEMYTAARPAVLGNGGRVIKLEADNLFAVFDSSTQALEGALDILRSFDAINGVVPDDRDIFGSIGIGFGPTLVIDEEDFFGCEVNLASKLGEDLARNSEILLTDAALATLKPDRYRFESCREFIGGAPHGYHRLRACLGPDGEVIEVHPRTGRAPV